MFERIWQISALLGCMDLRGQTVAQLASAARQALFFAQVIPELKFVFWQKMFPYLILPTLDGHLVK